MLRLLTARLGGRRAVSSMIGGLIMLSLMLTALVTIVIVSQQYDQYQQTSYKMVQYQNQQESENLVFNSPGLALLTSSSVSGWGSGCGGSRYNCYNMTVSNLGGTGVQIVRIYMNSTGSGCTSLCVLNPSSSIASYTFNQANSFLNAGEVNHGVALALPKSVTLPSSLLSQNAIFVTTSMGNVFSFRWPFPIQTGGQSQSAFSAGIEKIAYQPIGTGGYDSKNEPSFGGSGTGACHHELMQPYPAGANNAEILTGISGVSGNTLYFVNPWITQTIFGSAENQTNPLLTTTAIYLYVNITNTGTIPLTVAGGSVDLTWFGSNWGEASLIGFYKKPGTFYPIGSAQTIMPGESFYAIFHVTNLQLDTTGGGWPPPNQKPGDGVMFLGSAALTSNAKSETFVAGVGLMSGLWVRYSCQ